MRVSLSLSHPPYTPPLLSSRATASGRLLFPFFPLGLANSSGLGRVILVFGGPLSPSPLRYYSSADYALVPVASGFHIPLLPSYFPWFRSVVYSVSFICYAFLYYFLLRFSFLPSSLALLASHPLLSVEVLFIGFLS